MKLVFRNRLMFRTGWFIFFIALIGSTSLRSEILEPVRWEFSHERLDSSEYLLIFKAVIDDGWKMYGRDLQEGGPIPTSIVFDEASLEAVDLIGEMEALGRLQQAYEPLFEMDLNWYEKRVIFRQKLRLLENSAISGYVEFMTCDKKQCLPPTAVDFNFALNKTTGEAEQGTEPQGLLQPVKWNIRSQKIEEGQYRVVFEANIDKGWKLYSQDIEEGGPIPTSFHFEDTTSFYHLSGTTEEHGELMEAYEALFEMDLRWYKKKARFEQIIEVSDPSQPVNGFLEFMACDASQCLPPTEVPFKIDLRSGLNLLDQQELTATDDCYTFSIGEEIVLEKEDNKSLLTIFLLGLVGGFVALLTPCVFPMIPLTVSFFTKRSENRGRGILDASFYGLSIIFIYFLLSLPFIIFSIPPDSLNAFATNIYVNLAFFFIFVFFAFSFFGYYEIQLPSSWANKADSASGVGGMLGIFFMALTLAVVSFSCTGPILGSLLVGSISADGSQYNLVAGMLGFGLALAMPFALFAAFPGWLNSLPKSGGWLNTVKVTLGFLELGLALKFLSNADLVQQWGLLKREVFLGLWILIGAGLALYLLGKIRFPHDNPAAKLSGMRIATAVLTIAFVIYLVPGVFGKNLKLISGFPPPMFYSFYQAEDEEDDAIEEGKKVYHEGNFYLVKGEAVTHYESGKVVSSEEKKEAVLEALSHFEECPLDLMCFHSYQEGLAYARQMQKPIMIDFTGWACVNCRRMEENVWVQEKVNRRLSEDYVLISLYVDDKRKLPEEDQYISCLSGKKIKTIGNKWSDLQNTNFNTNSQPFYVLLSPDLRLLTQPVGYTPDPDDFLDFLEQGLYSYREMEPLASGE